MTKINEGNYGEKLYRVLLGTGTIYLTEAWMNRPVISDISSIIPKEDEVDGSDSFFTCNRY